MANRGSRVRNSIGSYTRQELERIIKNIHLASLKSDLSVTAGTGISGSTSTGQTVLSLDASELSALGTTAASGDYVVIQDVTDNSTKKVLVSNLPGSGGSTDIDALSAVAGATLHLTQDHFMVSDNGTEKKVLFEDLQNSIFANVSGDATIAASGAMTIANGAVENAMLAGSIVASKMANEIFADLETLGSVSGDGKFIVANGSGSFAYEDGSTARTSLGLGTGDSPQFTGMTLTGTGSVAGDLSVTGNIKVVGNVELGHASDTTLSRASSGDVNIEGNIIYRAGGTDVPVSDGGTGASTLTDGGVLLGSGTGAVTAMAVLSDGEMIVGDGSTDPVAESGATLRTSIGVGTGDSPQFTGMTLTGTGSVAGDLSVTGHLAVGSLSASVNISASAFYGDGSNLTNVGTITALNNNAENRLVTIGATTTELDAEANLTFDGNTLIALGGVMANMVANKAAIAATTTLMAGYNALMLGPITLNDGITLTVQSGAVLKIKDVSEL